MSQQIPEYIRISSTTGGAVPVPQMETNTSSNDDSQIRYKIVKVRKPDGTIVKVKRPISVEGLVESLVSKPMLQSTAIQASTPSISTLATGVIAIKNKKSTAVITTSPTKEAITTTTSELVSSQNETLHSVSTKVRSNTQVLQSEKTTVSSTKESQKPTESNTQTKTDRIVDNTRKRSRIFRGVRKLHKGSSRVADILDPDFDLGVWEDGDVQLDDDTDSDSDLYDSDEEQDGNCNHNQDAASKRVSTSAKCFTKATIANSQAQNTSKASSKKVEEEARPTTTTTKKLATFGEKEISATDSEKVSFEKPINSGAEGLNFKTQQRDWSRYVIWTIIIVFPLMFMIIGGLAIKRNKTPTNSSLAEGTEQALRVAVSIWPIIFAGIVAQSLRAYATYRVERGVRLMTLEQLINSHSVASSIKQPFLLRRFNGITIALLVLWSLSPLATQAMQRISSTRDLFTPAKPAKLIFIDTTANSKNLVSASKATFGAVEADFNRLYAALFLSTTLNNYDGIDPYGNALIPQLDETVNDTQWHNFDPDTFPTYVSAYGIPISAAYPLNQTNATDYWGLNSDSSRLFVTIPAAYLTVTCPPLQVQTYDQVFNTSDSTVILGEGDSKYTLYLDIIPMHGMSNGSLFVASMITLNSTDNTTFNLTDDATNITYATTNCSFSQVFLDLQINCDLDTCYTNKIRRRSPPSDFVPAFNESGAQNFVSGIIGSSGTTNYDDDSYTHTDTEKYLNSSNGDIIGRKGGLNL